MRCRLYALMRYSLACALVFWVGVALFYGLVLWVSVRLVSINFALYEQPLVVLLLGAISWLMIGWSIGLRVCVAAPQVRIWAHAQEEKS